MTDTTISFRASPRIAGALEKKARELGVSATDVILDALCVCFGIPRLAKVQLLTGVAALVDSHFDPRTFPEDVIKAVFDLLRRDPTLWPLYRSLVYRPDGSTDETEKGVVHRAIGRLVRERLGAKVKGRSAPLDPSQHLIKSHALLVPG
jgi:hypothetical protein